MNRYLVKRHILFFHPNQVVFESDLLLYFTQEAIKGFLDTEFIEKRKPLQTFQKKYFKT